MEFLLTFGGAELYIPRNPGKRSRIVAVVGVEKTQRLAENAHLLPRDVPLAKPWLAACMRAQGRSTNDIARTLRASSTAVRRWLNG